MGALEMRQEGVLRRMRTILLRRSDGVRTIPLVIGASKRHLF
jgi:hypothetical protein